MHLLSFQHQFCSCSLAYFYSLNIFLVGLSPSSLRGPTTVVRYRRYVADASHEQPCALQCPYGRFPAGSRSFNQYTNVLHPVVHAFSCCSFGCSLSRKSSAFSGSLEPSSSCAAPGYHVAGGICKGYQRVIESRLDVCFTLWYRFAFSSP